MPMRPSRLLQRQRDGVTAVAVRHSLHGSSSAATAAPLRLRHAGPAAQLTPRPLGARSHTCRNLPRHKGGASDARRGSGASLKGNMSYPARRRPQVRLDNTAMLWPNNQPCLKESPASTVFN